MPGSEPLPGTPRIPDSGLSVELVGVLHVHTTFSDGSGSPAEVVEAAAECGLDFIGINDHMSLGARESGYSGRISGVLALSGAEMHDKWWGGHHLLVYGVDRLPAGRSIRGMIEDVAGLGGIAIAAHPCEHPGYLPMTRSIRWRSVPPGLGGVEVWNYMSQWKAGVTPLDLARRLREPDRFVKSPARDTVAFWEKAGGCAVGGPDAHAFLLRLFGRTRVAFPYRMLFGRIRTHVLLDRAAGGGNLPTEADLVRALAAGSCFVSNALLGDARGFRMRRVTGGVEVEMPGPGDGLLRAGGGEYPFQLGEGRSLLPAPAGVPVSLDVRRKGRTWIWCGLCC